MFTLSIFHFLSSLPMVARVIILKSEPAQIGFELGYPSSQNSSESFCCSWGKIHCSLPHSSTCIPRLGIIYLLYQPHLKARFALFFHWSLSHLGPYIAAQIPGMLFCWFWGCPTPAVPSGPRVEGPFTEKLSLTPTSVRTPCCTSRVSNSALRVPWKVRHPLLKPGQTKANCEDWSCYLLSSCKFYFFLYSTYIICSCIFLRYLPSLLDYNSRKRDGMFF